MSSYSEYQFSGKALREIYAECCKKYGCKKNSAIYQLLSPVPNEYDGVEELDLSTNVVGSKGVLALLNVVAVARRLTTLSLKGNSLDFRAIQELVQVAKTHRSLTRIDVSHNRIGTAGKAILDLLKQNSRVLEVKLENTYIDAYMLKRISERLVANRMAAMVASVSSKEKQAATLPEKGTAEPVEPTSSTGDNRGEQTGPSSSASSSSSTASEATTKPSVSESASSAQVTEPLSEETVAPMLDAAITALQASSSAATIGAPSVLDKEESFLSQNWWENAVPLHSGTAYQPTAPTAEQVGEDFDWLGFNIESLFDISKYHTFLPVATKLIQLHTQGSVERPPNHLLDGRHSSVSSDSSGSTESSVDSDEEDEEDEEGEEEEEEEEEEAEKDESGDKDEKDEKEENMEDCVSTLMSEFDLDLDLESCSSAQGGDVAMDDVCHQDSDESIVPGFVGVEEEETEMGGAGVSAEDLIYMSSQDVEAKLAAVVQQVAMDQVGVPLAVSPMLHSPSPMRMKSSGFDSLFEKRLALLNVIYKMWIPHCIQSQYFSEIQYVNRFPASITSASASIASPDPGTIPGPAPLSLSLSDHGALLLSLLKQLSVSPELNSTIIRMISTSVENYSPLSLAPGSLAGQPAVNPTPNPPLPEPVMDSVHQFLLSAISQAITNVPEPSTVSSVSLATTLTPAVQALVALTMARAQLRDLLSVIIVLFQISSSRLCQDITFPLASLLRTCESSVPKRPVPFPFIRSFGSQFAAQTSPRVPVRCPSINFSSPNAHPRASSFAVQEEDTSIRWSDVDLGSYDLNDVECYCVCPISSETNRDMLLLHPDRPQSLLLGTNRGLVKLSHETDASQDRWCVVYVNSDIILTSASSLAFCGAASTPSLFLLLEGIPLSPVGPELGCSSSSMGLPSNPTCVEIPMLDPTTLKLTTSVQLECGGYLPSTHTILKITADLRYLYTICDGTGSLATHPVAYVYIHDPRQGMAIIRQLELCNPKINPRGPPCQKALLLDGCTTLRLGGSGGQFSIQDPSSTSKSVEILNVQTLNAAASTADPPAHDTTATAHFNLNSAGGHTSNSAVAGDRDISAFQQSAHTHANLSTSSYTNKIGELTVELWVKIHKVTSSKLYSQGTYKELAIWTEKIKSGIRWTVGFCSEAAGPPDTGGCSYEMPTSTVLRLWTHVCAVFAKGQWRLYINGIHASSSDRYPITRIELEDKNWTVGQGYVGVLAELRVWNMARSGIAIERDIRAELMGDESGLCAYFKMDEGLGSILHDTVSHCKKGWESRDGDSVVGLAHHQPAQWTESDLTLQKYEIADGSPGRWTLPMPMASSNQYCTNGHQLLCVVHRDNFPFMGLVKGREDASAICMAFDLDDGSLQAQAFSVAPPQGSEFVDGAVCFDGSTRSLMVFQSSTTSITLIPSTTTGVECGNELDLSMDFDVDEAGSSPTSTSAASQSANPQDADFDMMMSNHRCAALPADLQQTHVSAECVAMRMVILISQFNQWPKSSDRLCFYLPMYADVHTVTFERLLQLLNDSHRSATGMRRSVKQLYIVWVCLQLFITNFSILIRSEVNPKLLSLDISDRQGVLYTLYRILEEVIDDETTFSTMDPRAVLQQRMKQDAKRLIYVGIQYFFPLLSDRVTFLTEIIPHITAKKPVSHSLLTRLRIMLRYLTNTPSAVACIVTDSSNSPYQPTVLTLVSTLLEAMSATLHSSSSPSAVQLSLNKDYLGFLTAIQKSVVAMAIHHCSLDTNPAIATITPLGTPTTTPTKSGIQDAPSPISVASAGTTSFGQAPPSAGGSRPSTRGTSGGLPFPTDRAGEQYMKKTFFPYMRLLFNHVVMNVRHTPGMDEDALDRLRKSFCGALFGSFVGSLSLFTLYTDEILKGMQAVVTVAADTCLALDFVRLAEKQLIDGERTVMELRLAQKVIQSAHPYKNGGHGPQKICFPGAKAVNLVFDKRCATNLNHVLYVYLPGRDYESEAEHFSGPAEWPSESLHFADTDTLMFHFHVDPYAEDHGHWGYRCTLTGKVEIEYPSLHWLHDTMLGLFYSAGRIASCQISSYTSSDDDSAILQYMNEGGIGVHGVTSHALKYMGENIDLGEDIETLHPIWVEIVNNEGTGKILLQALHRQNPILHAFGGEEINHVLRCIFAAVIKQMGVDPDKLKTLVENDESIPSEVSRIFRCVERLRNWLLESRQRSGTTTDRVTDRASSVAGGRTEREDRTGSIYAKGDDFTTGVGVLLNGSPDRCPQARTSVDEAFGRALILLHSSNETVDNAKLLNLSILGSSTTNGKAGKKAPPSSVQRLQKLMKLSKQTGKDFRTDSAKESKDHQLLAFIQDERITMTKWFDFVQKRRLLGRRRLYALECFEELVFNYEGSSVKGPIMSMFIDSLKGHHYFDNLLSCGKTIGKRIQQKIYSIVSRMVGCLLPIGVPPQKYDPESCHKFLDLMSVLWKGQDYKFIDKLHVLGLFQSLFSLQRHEELAYKQVALKAWRVFQLLVVRAALEGSLVPDISNDGMDQYLEEASTESSFRKPTPSGTDMISIDNTSETLSVAADFHRGSIFNIMTDGLETRPPEGIKDFLQGVVDIIVAELATSLKFLSLLDTRYTSIRQQIRKLDRQLLALAVQAKKEKSQESDKSNKKPQKESATEPASAPSESITTSSTENKETSLPDVAATAAATAVLSAVVSAGQTPAETSGHKTWGPLWEEAEALQKERATLCATSQGLEKTNNTRVTHSVAFLSLVNSLITTSPLALDLVSDQLLPMVFAFMSRRSFCGNTAVFRFCFVLLRHILPKVLPEHADTALKTAAMISPSPFPTPDPIPGVNLSTGVATVQVLFQMDNAYKNKISLPGGRRARTEIVKAYFSFDSEHAVARVLKTLYCCNHWRGAVMNVIESILIDQSSWIVPGWKDEMLHEPKDEKPSTDSDPKNSDSGSQGDGKEEGSNQEDEETRQKNLKRMRKQQHWRRFLNKYYRGTRRRQRTLRAVHEVPVDTQRSLRMFRIAFSVLGGGQIRVAEGYPALCRLWCGMRQRVWVHKIRGVHSAVVFASADGQSAPGSDQQPRDVHSDRLVAIPEKGVFVHPGDFPLLLKVATQMLGPMRGIMDLKMRHLQKRFADSQLLPRIAAAIYFGLPDQTDFVSLTSEGLLEMLLSLIGIEVELPFQIPTFCLDELSALINFIVPYRTPPTKPPGMEDEESDDESSSEEESSDEESSDGESSDEDGWERACENSDSEPEEDEEEHDAAKAKVKKGVAEEGATDTKEATPENNSTEEAGQEDATKSSPTLASLGKVVGEYNYSTFVEGDDSGSDDDDDDDDSDGGSDSDEELYVFRRSEVLRGFCSETRRSELKRGCWKVDLTLAIVYAAKSVISILCNWKEEFPALAVSHIGNAENVVKFVFKCSDLVRRYEVDSESFYKAVTSLLQVYEERRQLVRLLIEQALESLGSEPTDLRPGMPQFSLALLHLIDTHNDEEISSCLYTSQTFQSLVMLAHKNTGKKRRRIIHLISSMLDRHHRFVEADRPDLSLLLELWKSLVVQYKAEADRDGSADVHSMFVQCLMELVISARAVEKEWGEIPNVGFLNMKVKSPIPERNQLAVPDCIRLQVALNVIEAFMETSVKYSEQAPLPAFLTHNLKPVEVGQRIGGQCVEVIPLEDVITIKGVDMFLPFHGFSQPVFEIDSFGNFSSLVANVAVKGGKWYYECLIKKCSLMQVGWVTRGFTYNSEEGNGVGDDTCSWAYDGIRNRKWHNGEDEPYGEFKRRDPAGRGRTRRRGRRRLRSRDPRVRSNHRWSRRRQNRHNRHRPSDDEQASSDEDMDEDAAATTVTTNGTKESEGDKSSDDVMEEDALSGSDDFMELIDEDDDDELPDAHNPMWRPGDVIGCMVSIENGKATMAFTHNGMNLGVAFEGVLVDQNGLYPAISMRSGDKVILNLGGSTFRYPPPGYQPLTDNLAWMNGIHQAVAPAPESEDQEQSESSFSGSSLQSLDEAIVNYYNDQWTKLVGAAIANSDANATVVTPEERFRKSHAVDIFNEEATEDPIISKYPFWLVQRRFNILCRFNILIKTILPIVNMASIVPLIPSSWNNTLAGTGLLSYFSKVKQIIFAWNKEDIFQSMIVNFSTEGYAKSVVLNRIKPSKHSILADANTNPNAKSSPFSEENTLFHQLYERFKGSRPCMFRQHESCDLSTARLWTVVFEGEAAEDQGGPFRESLAQLCEELMSDTVTLFIPSPNQRNNFGATREMYVPNPSCNSPNELNQFRFLGRLMAGCITINEPLNINLPSLVWKMLVNSPTDKVDLCAVDEMCVKCLDDLCNIDKNGVTPEEFPDIITETFKTVLSDGSEKELIENGLEKAVTFEERHEYARLVIDARLSESYEQIMAIRQGLLDVLPPYFLALITWKELELCICGVWEIDIHELQKTAIYEDVEETDQICTFFWEALSTFSQKELKLLLRFIAGRSRLPLQIKIRTVSTEGNPDTYLPQAHTCFFSIELPAYSSVEAMRTKLLYAIYNCRAIDTDGDPEDMEDDDDFEGDN